MNSFCKRTIRGSLIAAGLILGGIGAASAGEWRLDPEKCPALHENHIILSNGGAAGIRDQAVITCPTRAWFYVRGADDSKFDLDPPRPTQVVAMLDPNGHTQDFYYRD